jgi:hypothetical protein
MAEKVFIDLDEEITFVTEKVKKVEGNKVILVIPERAALLGSTVSLKLLFSEIAKLDKVAVIATEDEVGLKLAKQANLVAVKKVGQISDEIWKKVLEAKKSFLDKKQKSKEELIGQRNEQVSEKQETPPKLDKDLVQDKKIEPQKVKLGEFEMVAGGDIAETDRSDQPDLTDRDGKEKEKQKRLDSNVGLVGKDLSTFSYTSMAAAKKPKKRSEGPSIGERFNTVFEGIKGFFTKGGMRTKVLIGLGIALIIFLGVSYFVLPTGKVIVQVESEDIEFEKDIIADTAVSVLDIENLTIPAKVIEVSKDRSDSASATGTKETGEKASGQVTIYNKTTSQVTIVNGTTLESIETGLKYKTTTDVTVDAKKPDDDPEYPGMYGVVDVGIIAESFGEDYNTSEKQEFRIQGYAVENIYGKNFNSITGGTTEEITVVSQEDYDNLKTSLEDLLKEDLAGSLEAEAGSSRQLLTDTIQYETINESASPGVDAQASTFSLSVTVKATALSFLNEDIDNLAEVLVEEENEQNVEVEEFEYSSSVTSTEGNKIYLKLSITGVVTPSVDQDGLKTSLAGKSKGAAQSYLDSQEQIKDYEIKLFPLWLPSFLRHFPNSTGKISVEIEKVSGQ